MKEQSDDSEKGNNQSINKILHVYLFQNVICIESNFYSLDPKTTLQHNSQTPFQSVFLFLVDLYNHVVSFAFKLQLL